MPSYKGAFAELYDVFYAEKNYLQEAQFIHQWLKRFGKKDATSLLEIACGTGNHSFPLEKAGYKLNSLDYSLDMIKMAKRKAKALNSSVKFSVSDMRKLPLYGNKFDAAICLFDSIGYALTNEAILNTLIGIRGNLKKQGLFVFEFWHAAAMLKHYEKRRVRNISLKDGSNIKRVSETEIDYFNQSCSVKYTITFPLKNDKLVYSETHLNRFFSVPEISLFLQQTGFVPIKFYDGFSNQEKITDHSWHIVVVSQRK